MPQTINTNVMSLNAQRNLNRSQGSLQTSLQRLSSGLRINSAKDDAAGLAVSQKMLAQIRSLNQAARNANDGISMLQTAEGSMQEIQGMLQRMKELATQAANGTLSDTERGFINTEVQQLRDEMDDIATRTNFNGQKLLNGNLSASLDATTGINAGTVVVAGTNTAVTAVDVSKAAAGKTFTFTYTAATDALELSDGTNAQTLTLGAIAADSSLTLDFNSLGVKLTIGSVTGDTADNVGAGLTTKTVITAAGSGSLSLQIGSGTTSGVDTISVTFADVRVNSSTDAKMTALKTALDDFNTGTATQAEASALMSKIDDAIDFFSNKRADLGAIQNRLESTVANIEVNAENLAASRGRIVDADFAAETAELTRTQILQQAGVAMLGQANAIPQNVLALLQ